jgi:hypothetical protein
MIDGTHEWWALLRTVAAVNVLAWWSVAWWSWRVRAEMSPPAWQLRRWQLLLSAGYVLGCAWRSLLPVYDVPRLVMVDSFWSSVIVGRSVATVAELCFAAQWALLLRALSASAGSATGLAVSRAVLPLIVTAETFSWYSVLTTSNIGHVVEESLWGLCAALLVLSVVLAWPRVERAHRPLLAFGGASALAYAIYLFGVDVPMYLSRWLADEAAGRGALGVAQGFVDASTRWVVSHRWEDWRGESLWMSLYFSVGVWLSMALALVPTLRRRGVQLTSDAPMAMRVSRPSLRRTLSASDRS